MQSEDRVRTHRQKAVRRQRQRQGDVSASHRVPRMLATLKLRDKHRTQSPLEPAERARP